MPMGVQVQALTSHAGSRLQARWWDNLNPVGGSYATAAGDASITLVTYTVPASTFAIVRWLLMRVNQSNNINQVLMVALYRPAGGAFTNVAEVYSDVLAGKPVIFQQQMNFPLAYDIVLGAGDSFSIIESNNDVVPRTVRYFWIIEEVSI